MGILIYIFKCLLLILGIVSLLYFIIGIVTIPYREKKKRDNLKELFKSLAEISMDEATKAGKNLDKATKKTKK